MSGLARLASSARPALRPALVLASLVCLSPRAITRTARAPAQLSLTVSGLPTGTAAQVTLTGPGFSRVVSGTEVVANLKPGHYTLTPASVLNGLTRYSSITPPADRHHREVERSGRGFGRVHGIERRADA